MAKSFPRMESILRLCYCCLPYESSQRISKIKEVNLTGEETEAPDGERHLPEDTWTMPDLGLPFRPGPS